uniref:Ixodegrin B n=1 Tax=Rhipicephalus appendiculatus TaxID=34631 RepID=A0A131YE38_RHIAP
MLIRLSILLATCALSLTAEVAVEEKNDDNPFPKWLIEVGSHVNESDTAIYSTRRPRVTGKVKGGTICLNTEECGVGKCCLRRGKDPRRKCRRYQRIGQRCTDDQMMGGYYQNYCPCNRHSICAVVGHVLKCVKRQPIQRPQGPRPTTPPQEEKESKESEEISTRPGAPPKNPSFNQTKLEFPEIPEFFKTFGTSESSLFGNEEGGGGGEGGEGGEEEGEEEEEAGKHGDDLPEDIVPGGGGKQREEPPEESKEAEGPEAPPVSSQGSGGRRAQRLAYHVPGGGAGGVRTGHLRPLTRDSAVLTGLPGDPNVPSLPPPPMATTGSGERGAP